MTGGLYRLTVPALHHLSPTPGPRGVAGWVLSRVLGVDANRMVHVTRHLDVMEVLEREDDFSVRLYDEKMTETTGPFYLGMGKDRYDPEARTIWRVVRKEDAALVRRIAREETELAIERVRSRGRIDVVRELAEVVPLRFVVRYYGAEVPDPDRLLRLLQATSKYVFAFWSDPQMQAEACQAGREVRALLEDAIAARRRDGKNGDADVLGRLLGIDGAFADGDAGIARSLAGLSSGNLNPPIGLMAQSVDKLMSLGSSAIGTLHDLATSAVRGSRADAEAFGEWLCEAQRFSVYPPFSYRYAERDVVIAAGTPREKAIPRASTVVTWQSLAAFDPDVFDEPFEFRPGRPSWQYMGFGHARHRCLGEHIGKALLHAMCAGLFALPRLRRAGGKAGRLQTLGIREGKYATSLVLEFDPAPRRA